MYPSTMDDQISKNIASFLTEVVSIDTKIQNTYFTLPVRINNEIREI